jgi:hypothetical protein
VRHRREAEIAERDLLETPVGGMPFDPLPLFAGASAVMQSRRVAIRSRGQRVKLIAGKGTHAFQVRQQVPMDLRVQVQREERRE